MNEQRTKALKTVLQLVCQIQWLVGLMVALSGVYLLLKYKQSSLFFSHSYIALPVLFIFASAAFLLASGFLGSWVSIRDSVCLQGMFVYLLVVVFCLGSTAAALAYYHSIKLESDLQPLSGVFKNYTGNSQDRQSWAVDTLQERMRCCGVHGYRDWWNTSWFNCTGGRTLPHSCCNSTFTSCNGSVSLPWEFYQLGCHEKLQFAFQFMLSFVMWIFLMVFLVQVILFGTVVQLMKEQAFRHYDYQSLDKS